MLMVNILVSHRVICFMQNPVKPTQVICSRMPFFCLGLTQEMSNSISAILDNTVKDTVYEFILSGV